tara:strand:+ start:73 stop:303 length:231 start_codon:yes stop_codon:yes gene_type:complete
MHDDIIDGIIINTDDINLTYDTVTIPATTMSPSTSTITLSMPEEDVFVKTPDYDSIKVKKELGIDMIQEIKRSFGE